MIRVRRGDVRSQLLNSQRQRSWRKKLSQPGDATAAGGGKAGVGPNNETTHIRLSSSSVSASSLLSFNC